MFWGKSGIKEEVCGKQCSGPYHRADGTKVFRLAGRTNVHRDSKSLV